MENKQFKNIAEYHYYQSVQIQRRKQYILTESVRI